VQARTTYGRNYDLRIIKAQLPAVSGQKAQSLQYPPPALLDLVISMASLNITGLTVNMATLATYSVAEGVEPSELLHCL
jgi:hypothetical protein